MKIVKTTQEFREYLSILESLGDSLFDIPGLQKCNAHLKNEVIELQISNGDMLWINLEELKNIASDEYNKDPLFLKAITNLYQEAVSTRYIADISNKIKIIRKAESFVLFDITYGGFFANIENDLKYLGASNEDITAIITNLPNLYDTGATDGISPEGVTMFTIYINSILEFIGSKIYIYLEYLGKDDFVIKRVQGGNIDNVLEEALDEFESEIYESKINVAGSVDYLQKEMKRAKIKDWQLIYNESDSSSESSVFDVNLKDGGNPGYSVEVTKDVIEIMTPTKMIKVSSLDNVIKQIQYLMKKDGVFESEIYETEAVGTGEYGNEFGQSSYTRIIDFDKSIEFINRIAKKAAMTAGFNTLPAFDQLTRRKPNATTIYIEIPIDNTNLSIVSILNPVEHKKINNTSTYVFAVESDGIVEEEYSNLLNEIEITQAINNLLNVK